MKKFTTFILASLLLATGLSAQKTPIVGVVDFNRVRAESTEIKAAVERVQGSLAPVNEEIQRMQASMQAIITEMRETQAKADNPAASEAARAEAASRIGVLQAEGQELEARFNQFRQQAQQLQQKGQEDVQPLIVKAIEATKKVAEDKGIDLVVPSASILYHDEELEITDAVIAVLNSGE